MGKRREWAYVGAGSVAAVLLVGVVPVSGVPGPELENVWETGTVTKVYDGDTIEVGVTSASLAKNLGSQRVRTIGVQAPEVAHTGQLEQCGAAQATSRLKSQLPIGAPVQLRSLLDSSYDDYSDGRIVRSIYAQDGEGNWFDTSRGTVSDGWLMWFPLSDSSTKKPEWAHNLEYRVLADDAADQRRGLWQANLCGATQAPDAQLRVWVAYDTGGSYERAWVANDGTGSVDISGWTLRDSALNMYIVPCRCDDSRRVQCRGPADRRDQRSGGRDLLHEHVDLVRQPAG